MRGSFVLRKVMSLIIINFNLRHERVYDDDFKIAKKQRIVWE